MAFPALILLLSCLAFLETHALPDYTCVCEKYDLNACSRSYSCRLNSSVAFDPPPAIPSWVTVKETSLVANTIAQAKNGLLRPPIYDLGKLTWESRLACDDATGVKQWHQSQLGCPASPAANSTARLHGWASLGFHPLGGQPGTWLTQILGVIDDSADGGDNSFSNARCAAGVPLYINLTYINDTTPYDPRFSPLGYWGFLYGGREYPTGRGGVPSYRTDGDLIAHGVDLNCSGADKTGQPCTAPSCQEPPVLAHFDCPATNSGSVGIANCRRVYLSNAAADRFGLFSGVLAAGLIASGFILLGG